jgi:hypothetical protein
MCSAEREAVGKCAKVDSLAAGFYRTLIGVKAVWPEWENPL